MVVRTQDKSTVSLSVSAKPFSPIWMFINACSQSKLVTNIQPNTMEPLLRRDVRLVCRERELLKNTQYGNKLANTKRGDMIFCGRKRKIVGKNACS